MTRLLSATIVFVVFTTVLTVMEEVVLLEQPQSGYVIKSRPYQLSCKALNAKKIRFKCNNKWVDESRHESLLGTDPASQLPYMESLVEITRQEVDTSVHLEDFTCQCYASGTSDSHVVRSDAAKIRVAYMRKHFTQIPTSERVPEGSTVQLPCVAPESDPRATITWHKDGVELARSADSNLIYASDGSLIISATRLTDSGNYSCEAANAANKRSTDPATLNVYVNGGWSEWSGWTGGCQADCELIKIQMAAEPNQDVIPKLRRTRTCNNPAPLNGGSYCQGGEEDLRACSLPCRLDGRWSKWSDWSVCSSTCHRFRTRTCTQPINGGQACLGRDLETSTCNEGYCQPSSSALSSEATVLLSCVALVLFFVMGLCLAVICRRNKGKKHNNNNNIYYAESGAHVRRVLMDQKTALLDEECHKLPGSQFFTLASTCSPSPLHPSMTLRSAKSQQSAYSAHRNVGSRTALLPECSSTSSSGGKRTILRTSSNCSDDENYATLYDFMEDAGQDGLESSQAVLAAQIDCGGARIVLPKSGASVLIPEGAVEDDRMVYLAVSDQIDDRPHLQSNESCLSAIIVVGECSGSSSSSSCPRRPLVVSFRHCASVFPRDNWTFTLYADEGFGWQPAVTVGEETVNTSMHVHMDQPSNGKDGMGWCHVMMENYSRVMLAGRPRRPNAAPLKRVHLAAYGPDRRPDGPFEIRVYCVPETGAAMESVTRQEERGRLLAESDHFLLNERGDLCFCVEDVADGFAIIGSNIVDIPSAQHLWCAQNGLHCSLTVDVGVGVNVEEFAARIVAYQKINSAEPHILHVRFENCIYDKPSAEPEKAVSVDFLLPGDVKFSLGLLLDPPNDSESDWRQLARKLHFDRYLQYFGTRPGCSPTVLLLSLWEASHWGSARAVHDLLQTLRVMGRPDAVRILERKLANFDYIMSP